ncbi:peptide ABC transporter substrate-binding protein [Prodigiosinella confusarubida]|uniref:Peptide ABC transporter substrate-binding protein n=1 Tax=Serratia sp. (strain ATCC 39006) TaxID=104623 RepID=A0A2I5T1X7_SERS3|nr:ABC transporter substrate-binding protein [Serratia sp. ATCC 39006]AUG98554.1 peptide ABC transporter substrate-binding protein [Serratia sp. ATCC 39006]AUH02869.1 peptide ABC transporter substrate-binding protein [Serratia sp. ATCC 39006]
MKHDSVFPAIFPLRVRRHLPLIGAFSLAVMHWFSAAPAIANTLRIVPASNITVLDPIWTTAYSSRNFGYMVFDTLFGTDAKGKIQPQMVQSWQVSDDKKTWTFTLRDGLAFSDGAPVTSADVIASLKRWMARDTLGGLMAGALDHAEAVDDKTFKLVFRTPFGPVLEALGKPSSNVPFIMPKRIADTPADTPIKEIVGSGPYVFEADRFRPGESLWFRKNTAYHPRSEPPSGTAGGKRVFVDEVEWKIIRDPQTQMNALLANEVDILEQPAFEQLSTLAKTPHVRLINTQPNGFQFMFRFNFIQPPFNDVKVRQAAMWALGQEPMLRTQVGQPKYYRTCASLFPCGTPYASDPGPVFTGKADLAKARALLKQSSYKGEPIVLLRPTDNTTIGKLPLVAQQMLQQAGFKVQVMNMDWPSLVSRRAKKDAPNAGGWNAFISAWGAEDVQNPLNNAMLNATGDKGWFGWQNDPHLEELKARFAAATDNAQKQQLAHEIQSYAYQIVTHVPLGQYMIPAAVRDSVSGIVPAGAQVYWNIRKSAK